MGMQTSDRKSLPTPPAVPVTDPAAAAAAVPVVAADEQAPPLQPMESEQPSPLGSSSSSQPQQIAALLVSMMGGAMTRLLLWVGVSETFLPLFQLMAVIGVFSFPVLFLCWLSVVACGHARCYRAASARLRCDCCLCCGCGRPSSASSSRTYISNPE